MALCFVNMTDTLFSRLGPGRERGGRPLEALGGGQSYNGLQYGVAVLCQDLQRRVSREASTLDTEVFGFAERKASGSFSLVPEMAVTPVPKDVGLLHALSVSGQREHPPPRTIVVNTAATQRLAI